MKNSNQKMAAVVALMAVMSLAMCFIIMGAISVELMDSLKMDAGKFGTLILGLFLTSCIVQLFIGPLVDKVGYKPVAFIGFSVISISFLLLSIATTFTSAFIASVLLGVGAMAVNTVGNTLIPVVLFEGKDPARASNLGNGFYGIGYILTPLLMVFMLNNLELSYKVSLLILAGLMLLFLIFSLFATYPKVSTGFEFKQIFNVLKKPAVIIAAIALFCYVALEVSMSTWIRSLMDELYITDGSIGSSAKTGIVLSLFGVAMMTGRFITSSIKNLTAIGARLIVIMSVLSLVAIFIMIIAKSPVLGIVAVIMAGLAFAPLFPTIVGITFSRFEPGLYGTVFGIIFAVGLLGGTFVPNYVGQLSVGSSVQQSLIIPAIMAGLLIIVSLILGRIVKSKE